MITDSRRTKNQLEEIINKLNAPAPAGRKTSSKAKPDPSELLRQVLVTWKERVQALVDPIAAVAYLAILLDNTYSTSQDFSAATLRESDTRIAQYLRPLADEVGFTLYLAQMEACYECEVDLDDGSEMADGEIHRSVRVIRIVDLDGGIIHLPAFKPRGDDEITDVFPAHGSEADQFINGPLMDFSLEADEDEEAAKLPTRLVVRGFEDDSDDEKQGFFEDVWYRTALLIWPSNPEV
ncbi:hypothetical protein C8F01DRAFT_1158392 [Mycena amicta]|nr:hypothetical protein C8F01DRAFT_1158392 [Mycena amicta]